MTTTPRLSVDTSVAVPLLVASHEHHTAVARWASGQSLSLAGHALAETYSVLTRLPGDARVAPSDAVVLIDENFSAPLVLSIESAQGAHRELASNGIAGGATYDGLVALASREHGSVLVTRDARARSTYERLGVAVDVLTTDDGPGADRRV